MTEHTVQQGNISLQTFTRSQTRESGLQFQHLGAETTEGWRGETRRGYRVSSTTAGKTPATKISKKTSHEANCREMPQHRNSKGPFSSLFLVCSDTSLVSGIARANKSLQSTQDRFFLKGWETLLPPLHSFSTLLKLKKNNFGSPTPPDRVSL